MAFTHLHTHTEYSLLDGSNKIKEYIGKVKELGMDSAAITDHGVMFGVLDFYKEAKAQGIHPVLGCEIYVAAGSRFDREVVKGEDRYYHMVLLAENQIGYQNLMKIVSIGYVEGYYYKPRVDKETIIKYHEGIIALSACLAGEIPRLLERGKYEEAKQVALEYENIFGKHNFYLELQDHGIPMQKNVNQQLLRIHQETGIDLVATNDIHYTNATDATAHDILLCIQTGKKVADEDRMRYEGGQYYVKSEEEMLSLFGYAKEAVYNTHKIAMRCQVEIEFGVTKLPHFEVPKGYDSWTYLNKICYEGLEEHYKEKAGDYKERLDYELGVIKKMGYVDYFLIVWDFINYARTNHIPVGPGRGSAAGSLVAYCTKITLVDPIKYNLIFERFLNPERVSMPDIDIDFCYERRGEVIDYVIEKYGKECVTQIVAFGTMAARGVIRDVGRVLDMPYGFVDSIAKQIPFELDITIEKALVKNPELRELYETEEDVANLIDTARKLEGLPRHTTTHAAGVMISQKAMDEYVPLYRTPDGSITTQFDKTLVEELGLLKMDFLGLRTLTVIDDAIKLVEENQHRKLSMEEIDYDDKQVLSYIGSGKTEGIFQLESAGMKNFMKDLKPESLEDVIAGISLYRPGPMEFIGDYIRGKNDKASIVYDCPQLEEILSPTYGCIVYQEQVMQIVRDLAGYSMGRSDMVRRAMSKKKSDVMERERKNFVYGNEEEGVEGCIKRGIDEVTANRIFDHMIDFAKYAFNKSHAAAYAVVAYQTAYLKYYYPVEFMAALLTSVIDHSNKVAGYIQVCRSMKIEVLPPDINCGQGTFAVSNGQIRYGMYAIKSVGRPVVDAICQDREVNGPFLDLEDFIQRISQKDGNKRTIENLIKAGALDCIKGNRRQKVIGFPVLLEELQKKRKNELPGQLSLMDMLSEEGKEELAFRLPEIEEFPKEEYLMLEKEVLGIYLSGHPLEEYLEVYEQTVTARSDEFAINEETDMAEIEDNQEVIVGGMITEKTIKFTKNNQTMAFITLEDLVGVIEVIVFPKTYEKYKDLLEADQKVWIKGRTNVEEGKLAKLICQEIKDFSEKNQQLWIQFANKEDFQQQEELLLQMLTATPGESQVVVFLADVRSMKPLGEKYKITISEEALERFYQTFGNKNVKVVEKSIEFGRKRS